MFHLPPRIKRNGNMAVRHNELSGGLHRDDFRLARLGERFDLLMAGFLDNRWLENRIPGDRPTVSEGARLDWSCGPGWKEKEKEYVFRVELPGFDAEDFDVKLDDDVLTVCAQHEVVKTEIRSSSRYCRGSFSRTLTLPDNVDANKILPATTAARLKSAFLRPEERTTGELRYMAIDGVSTSKPCESTNLIGGA